MLLSLVITFGEGNPLVQFFFIYFSSLLLLSLLGLLRPLNSIGGQRLELGNEYIVIVLFNLFVTHTDLV